MDHWKDAYLNIGSSLSPLSQNRTLGCLLQPCATELEPKPPARLSPPPVAQGHIISMYTALVFVSLLPLPLEARANWRYEIRLDSLKRSKRTHLGIGNRRVGVQTAGAEIKAPQALSVLFLDSPLS